MPDLGPPKASRRGFQLRVASSGRMKATLLLAPKWVLYVREDGAKGHLPLGDDAGRKLAGLNSGKDFGWVREVAEAVRSHGVESFATVDPQLHQALVALGYGSELLDPYRSKVDRVALAIEAGTVRSEAEYEEAAREVAMAATEAMIKEAVKRRDQMIVQAVRALDEVQKAINAFYSRLIDWYGIHFPELKELVEDPEAYVRAVMAMGDRSRIDRGALQKVLDRKTADRVAEAAGKSLGVEVAEEDMERILELAGVIRFLMDYRDGLQRYVRQLMAVEAPNVTAIAGPTVGARLITLIGGLDRLARAPASLIQVLGAEKALFRFLRTGRGAPKHGVIFQHPYVHGSPKWQRGKIARTLATKVAIAAKIDYFSGEDRSALLREELESRYREIKEKYPKPPARKEVVRQPQRPQRRERKERRGRR